MVQILPWEGAAFMDLGTIFLISNEYLELHWQTASAWSPSLLSYRSTEWRAMIPWSPLWRERASRVPDTSSLICTLFYFILFFFLEQGLVMQFWLSWNSLWNTWWFQTCSNPPAQHPECWACVPPYLAILELCYYKLWEMILLGPELSIQTHLP